MNEQHENALIEEPLRIEHEAHGRMRWFLGSLVLLFLLFPFHQLEDPAGVYRLALLAVNVLVMLTGIYVTGVRSRAIAFGAIAAIPFTAAGVVNIVLGHHPPDHWWNELYVGVAAIPFFSITFLSVFRHTLGGETVTTDKLYGAVCAYVLIGLVWAGLYSAVHLLHEPSFAVSTYGAAPPHELRFPDLVYFSFVTLTTLGYGDIAPLTPQAKILAIIEAIAGVFYLAILVARLVGLYRHQRTKL